MSAFYLGVFSGLAVWFTLQTVFSVFKLGETMRIEAGTVATHLIFALLATVGVVWFL